MDHPFPPEGGQPPPPPSPPLPAADAHQRHLGSPKRKKPRLMADGDSALDPSSSSPLPDASQQPAPHATPTKGVSQHPATDEPKTPSRITINLKQFSAATPVAPSVDGADNTDTTVNGSPNGPHEASTAHISETIDVSDINLAHGSPSPVQIEIPEDNDDSQDNLGDVIQIEDDSEQDADIIDTFPHMRNSTAPPAAAAFAVAKSITSGQLDVQALKNISDWLKSWFSHIDSRSHRWSRTYAIESDFWANVCLICHNVFMRRVLFNATDRLRFGVPTFFASFAHLFSHLLHVDLEGLDFAAHHDPAALSFTSSRAVKTLDLLFELPVIQNGQPSYNVSFWNLCAHDYDILPANVQQNVLIRILSETPDLIINMIKFATALMPCIQTKPDLAPMLLQTVRPLKRIFEILEAISCSENQPYLLRTTVNSPQQVCSSTVSLCRLAEQILSDDLERAQSSSFRKELAVLLGPLMLYACTIDKTTAQSTFRERFGETTSVATKDYAAVLQTDIILNMLFKFVSKGRMELRIASTEGLAEHLIQLYERRLRTYGPTSDSVVCYVGDFFDSHKVIQYLVGADSHTQIISRSGDILGFLFVTRQWTQEMTDAVWSTVSSSPDPRTRAETIHMLRQCMQSHADPKVLLQFCDKFAQIPVEAFDQNLLMLFTYLHSHVITDHTWEAIEDVRPVRQSLFKLCIRLAKALHARLYSAWSAIAVGNIMQAYQDLSEHITTLQDRQALYEDYVRHIEAHDDEAPGTLMLFKALLQRHWVTDIAYILDEIKMFHVMARDFCRFVSSVRNGELLINPQDSSSTAMDLLFELAGAEFRRSKDLNAGAPDLGLSRDIEPDLISKLIGRDAINDHFRNAAWSRIKALVIDSKTNNGFIDRLLSEYMPGIDPVFLTFSALDFIEAAVHYQLRLKPADSDSKSKTLDLLMNTLWRAAIKTPSGQISDYAAQILTKLHMEDHFVREDAADLHVALIDRCVRELHQIAAASTKKTEDETMLDDSNFVPLQVQFVRAVHFLERFLLQVRARPRFKYSPQLGASPSPIPRPELRQKGEAVSVKYQICIPGKHSEIRDLEIGGDVSLSDMVNEIARLKSLNIASIIMRGSVLTSETAENITAKEASGGGLVLLRVAQDSSEQILNSAPTSAAEQAIIRHAETIYGFLDLPGEMSYQSLRLLQAFPPIIPVDSAIRSESTVSSDIFPSESSCRTIYGLWSMQQILGMLVRNGPASPIFLARSTRHIVWLLLQDRLKAFDPSNPRERYVLEFAATNLRFLFRELSAAEKLAALEDTGQTLTERLLDLIDICKRVSQSGLCPMHDVHRTLIETYHVLIDTCFHNVAAWNVFIHRPELSAIHEWLLLENPVPSIRISIAETIYLTCQTVPDSLAINRPELISFFWSAMLPLIPKASHYANSCIRFFALAKSIFLLDDCTHDEASLTTSFWTWSRHLVKHEHREAPGFEEGSDFVAGLTELLLVCVTHLRAFKKPLRAGEIAIAVMDRFLLPPPPTDGDEDTLGGLPDRGLCSAALTGSLRRQLFNFVIAICEDYNGIRSMLGCLEGAINYESLSLDLPWSTDPATMLRAPAGFVGLENLTNTCYMNSLMAQLFMNVPFRNFLLSIEGSEDASVKGLLSSTQALFTQLVSTYAKYAETGHFAGSIEPYEGGQLDVTVQMDVEEFFNLLFERWEAQMPTTEDKKLLRSFFGGKLITQIKSLDCEHISERLEECSTIQCVVKGKQSLHESLEAYVEGDAMEGDNKYKCESCGGRFVNAVKRSCIKELPDNVIISLKRFDFDFREMKRCKVNDYFSFPSEVDMSRYKLEYLENPDRHPVESDVFELTGVLVHTGGAESGHYYSIIKSPYPDSTSRGLWYEFNDTEVTEFDPAKIDEQCFGGPWPSTGFDKPFNAYMLFYRRRKPQNVRSCELSLSSSRLAVPEYLRQSVALANDSSLRRHCLIGVQTSEFLRTLMGRFKSIDDGHCSENHELEKYFIEVVLAYAQGYLIRQKDGNELEKTLTALRRMCGNCEKCIAAVIAWFSAETKRLLEFLIIMPREKDKMAVVKFIADLLAMLQLLSPELYGLPTDPEEPEDLVNNSRSSAVPALLQSMQRLIPKVGHHARSWDAFFHLLDRIGRLGFTETFALINGEFFQDCVELVHALSQTQRSRKHFENATIIGQMKSRASIRWDGILLVLERCTAYINWKVDGVDFTSERISNTDLEGKKIPLTRNEKILIAQGDRHMTLIHELSDTGNPTVISKLVTNLLKCGLDDRTKRKLYATLHSILGEFRSDFLEHALSPALAFITHNPVWHDNEKMLEKAFKQFKQPDFDATGAQQALHFLRRLVNLKATDVPCMQDFDYNVIHSCIQRHASDWAPAMLTMKDMNIREETSNLIKMLLFTPPVPTYESASSIEKPDKVRGVAVRQLLDELCKVLGHAIEHDRATSHHVEAVRIGTCCYEWIEHLRVADPQQVYQVMQDEWDPDRLERWYTIANTDWHAAGSNIDDKIDTGQFKPLLMYNFEVNFGMIEEDDQFSDEYDTDGDIETEEF